MNDLTDLDIARNQLSELALALRKEHERTATLRAALHEAKRGCSRVCTDIKCATGSWDATSCTCGAVQHNAKIDAALKAAKP